MTQCCRVSWGNLGGLSFDSCHRAEKELKQPSKHILPQDSRLKMAVKFAGGWDTFCVASICPRKCCTVELWAACLGKGKLISIFIVSLQSHAVHPLSKTWNQVSGIPGLRAVNHCPWHNTFDIFWSTPCLPTQKLPSHKESNLHCLWQKSLFHPRRK